VTPRGAGAATAQADADSSITEPLIPQEAVVVADALARARAGFQTWSQTALSDRLKVIRRARRLIAAEAPNLAVCIGRDRPLAEGLVSETLPLADAARFLERAAPGLLAPRRLGRSGRPAWLVGVSAEVRREPCGVVLVLGPRNYPLFLPGVQVLQALVAGNAVVAKAAEGCSAVLSALADLLHRAGLPKDVLLLLPDGVAAGRAASRAAFDKIVLTGSAETGVEVLRAAASNITPCTMELSGDDPVFVLPGADLSLAARAIGYGLRLNRGETCIAPKRILAWACVASSLRTALEGEARFSTGGRGLSAAARPDQRSALHVPDVIPVRNAEEALDVAAQSPFCLGAAVFGPLDTARALAERIPAGCVVINDMIVPTADPRLPFGGRKRSGFGVTRGAEGLLEMTVLKTVSVRRGWLRPHLDPIQADDAALFACLIRCMHGSVRTRIAAAAKLLLLASRRR
jgi:acyl-CoA reductase-like NAD-dependent aldehyde dehydrogenase